MEGTTISVHLNEFNSIIKQLANQKFNIDDMLKSTFLLCTLPRSWDIFKIALSNSNPILEYAAVESQLLIKEMNRTMLQVSLPLPSTQEEDLA